MKKLLAGACALVLLSGCAYDGSYSSDEAQAAMSLIAGGLIMGASAYHPPAYHAPVSCSSIALGNGLVSTSCQ